MQCLSKTKDSERSGKANLEDRPDLVVLTPNIQVKRCEPRSVLCVLFIHSLQKLPSAEQVALGTRKSASLPS
jgi:hypothetical protein